MEIDPYLNFNGRADEAVEFYKRALGAKVNMLMRFKEAPPEARGGITPGSEEKIMHADLTVGKAHLLVSDGRCTGATKFEGIALSIKTSSDAETERVFTQLADRGKVTMPLTKTFFASSFGMVTDQFGVGWMVITQH
jgi:PhnB protein